MAACVTVIYYQKTKAAIQRAVQVFMEHLQAIVSKKFISTASSFDWKYTDTSAIEQLKAFPQIFVVIK